MVSNRKVQIANNNQIDDYLVSSGAQILDFSGQILELKYFVKSEKVIQKLLEEKSRIQKDIQNIKKDLKFSKIICRFYCGDYHPTLELQKDLIDWQKDIFDEVTAQFIGENFDTFKQIYEYALKGKKPVSTLIDAKHHLIVLEQILLYLKDMTPANTRWLYHKMDTYAFNYEVISRAMKKIGVEYYLSGCAKRYGVSEKAFRNVDVSVVARGYYGFSGCSLDYRPQDKLKRKGTKIFVPKETDRFNEITYEWEQVLGIKNFRESRTEDYFRMNSANTELVEMLKIKNVKSLFEHLTELRKKSSSE